MMQRKCQFTVICQNIQWGKELIYLRQMKEREEVVKFTQKNPSITFHLNIQKRQ